jgi:multiple sugar transport system ATP-binding protein
MASVELENIGKRWGNVVGVATQSLSIADGEFMVFLGPSGCGKTTTMRMIAGLLEPSEGRILIDGADVTYEAPKDRDIAMVFQNYGLYPHMTVADNIAYPLKVRGIPKAERQKQIKDVADRVELTALLDRRPSALSGGQRQRVALARAIVRRPKVFLMDEPLSNLDAQLRVSMRAEIKHLQREMGITTVYVTHDQIEALTLADRIVIMQKGVIQQLGTPEEIYNTPANLFVAGFIGSPAMNLINGSLRHGVFEAPEISISLKGQTQDTRDNVVLGIRPEDISVTSVDSAMVRGQVYNAEMTGDAVLVTADFGPARVCARADRHLRFKYKDPVGFDLDLKFVHLFDGKSGARL